VMRCRLVLVIVVAALLLLSLGTAVVAQEETPPPYAGLENPFPWEDTSAQGAGKGLYPLAPQITLNGWRKGRPFTSGC
jgi:hypothetical protein